VEQRRVCVLNTNQAGTAEMLSPFEPWSSCTMEHVRKAKKEGGARYVLYEPKSLPDMAVVDAIKGGLVPKQYASRGYFWWKAQEMTYALRPTSETKIALKEHKAAIGWPTDGTRVHGMQARFFFSMNPPPLCVNQSPLCVNPPLCVSSPPLCVISPPLCVNPPYLGCRRASTSQRP